MTGGDSGDMTAFGRYAAWYDAFNEGKDYRGEVEYVFRSIVAPLVTWPHRWLDIGSGTGHHVARLRSMGIAAEGVEGSPWMIDRAHALYPGIPFHLQRAQTLSLPPGWDVVTALFHVMSYQTSDDDLSSALDRVAAHLAPDGLLVFDFWNSEAVMQSPPGRRIREADIDGRKLIRVAVPVERREMKQVDVHYEFRWDVADGDLAHEETHTLRHFSEQELQGFLRRAGMQILRCTAWMSDRSLSADDWYGVICARLEPRR
jgi:SAM-dependent methyltransferase